jgi:hypothetical protein
MKYNKVKHTKRYGGSGGSSAPIESIPEWAVPYIKNVGNAAESGYQSGGLSNVAGVSGLQDQAFTGGAQAISAVGGQGLDTLQGQQQRLSTMATAPSAADLAMMKQGILLDAQKGVAGLTTGFGGNGTLGSARQAVMQGAQNADTTAKIAKVSADYDTTMFGQRLQAEGALGSSVGASANLASGTASSLANLGGQQRGIDQQQQDAGWQGLQRYASTIYGNPARQQATASGGK